MYSQKFKDFVNNGIDNYFVGTGNPNSNILFVGKESAISREDLNGKQFYLENAKSWKTHIKNNTCEILDYPINEDHQFRIEKSWGKNTWSKYQELKNAIYKTDKIPYCIDFLQKVFTTEINDAPEKSTAHADKSSLNQRKELFRKSEFIQKFPVVVLACSDYIKNNDYIREIDDIFDVTYFDSKVYSSMNWFFTHYNQDETKLVVHTRQLSANVRTDLLNDLGKIIRNHLKKNNLYNSVTESF